MECLKRRIELTEKTLSRLKEVLTLTNPTTIERYENDEIMNRWLENIVTKSGEINEN